MSQIVEYTNEQLSMYEHEYANKPIVWEVLAAKLPDVCIFCTDIIFDDRYPCSIDKSTVTPRFIIPAHALRATMLDDIRNDAGYDCTALFTTQRGTLSAC